MNLAMYILAELVKRLVVSGITVHIGLLGPFGTLYHNFVACLGQLAELGESGWADLPMKYFLAGTSGFALRSIVFSTPVHFWALWHFEPLYIGLDRLILMHLSIWGWS